MFHFKKSGSCSPLKNWPFLETGEPEPPVFLKDCFGADLDETLTVNLLESFGIPCVVDSRALGGAGETIMGNVAANGGIFVPESRLQDARAVLAGGDGGEATYQDIYQIWLDSPALDDSEREELLAIAENDDEIESRFYAPLEFGTAGLRGVMGTGLNRMNTHTVRHVTQAFADVINSEPGAAEKGVVVCFDCRNNSRKFAAAASCVMAANGIPVRLFSDMRPTPELSFAIREYSATAGINITASHNPKEYNGYKVYWSDGAQLPPQHADAISSRMEQLDIFSDIKTEDFDNATRSGKISFLSSETDEAFLAKVLGQAMDKSAVEKSAEGLKIVYTPFHGTGRELVPEALRRLGVKSLIPVDEQMVPDGSFPTVKSPNPEDPAGFYLAIELAKREGSSLIIGTDPDADRVGVMARLKNGGFAPITGNQMGVLLLDYIIKARISVGSMPENPALLKTIVSTEMARVVAESNGVFAEDTFTGFKFMAEKLLEYERDGTHNYILAFEESYGYMTGGYVRDKDAVTASVIIAEMAAHYHNRGMTLHDAMDELYEKYGYFGEKTLNLVMPGIDGLEKMRELMKSLRENPPAELSGVAVARVRDYLSGTITMPGDGESGKTEIFGSNVLYFETADGSSVIVRPSGTEPKVKVYILSRGRDRAECDEKIARFTAFAESLKK